MIKVEYVRDMHKNYFVLQGLEGKVSVYGVKMLLNNRVAGLLPVELRCIDHLDLFYYDVTNKKTIQAYYESKSLNYDEIHNLLSNILLIIEQSNEYLLLENDFIIDPSFIYKDCETQKLYLCHLVGYQQNVQEQLVKFVEYLMNRVDYKDEKAVLLIYAIYKVSREEDCTFDKIKKELNKYIVNEKEIKHNSHKSDETNKAETTNLTSVINTLSEKENIKSNNANNALHQKDKIQINDDTYKAKNNKSRNIGINKNHISDKITHHEKIQSTKLMDRNKKTNDLHKSILEDIRYTFLKNKTKNKNQNNYQNNYKNNNQMEEYKPILEEIESEKEVLYYENKVYILALITIIIGFLFIGIAYSQKILFNSFGNRLDPVKLISCLMIIGCLEGYIMLQLFQKKNKSVKIVPCTNYIEPDDYSKTLKDEIISNEIITNEIITNDILIYDERLGNDECINSTNLNLDDENKTQILRTEQDDYDNDKTVILSDLSNRTDSYLIPSDTDEDNKVPIVHYPFIIGKSEKSTNYILHEVGISRLHAKITKDGENYYLFDLASTNGTFLNGLKLKECTPYILHEKDEITFSNFKFSWIKAI